MGNDHKFTKSKSRYRQWYQSLSAARNTLDGMEAMLMIQIYVKVFIKELDLKIVMVMNLSQMI